MTEPTVTTSATTTAAMTAQTSAALKDLLFRIADDCLIIAHRHSEWTGFGPLLEEDIAFSSIAQDKLGHANAVYKILHEHFGEAAPDTIAFTRVESAFKCSQFVELPNGNYDFSLMRHFLFDASELFRWQLLQQSSFEPLAKLAKKIHGEIKYHVYHAQTWIIQLGAKGNEESHARMQSALDTAWPYALGIFEQGSDEGALINANIFVGEGALKSDWLEFVAERCTDASLVVPTNAQPMLGGRKGYHTEYLKPLLDEMNEVFRIDPSAEW